MEWTSLYGPNRQPTETETADYIGCPLWQQLNSFLQGSYGALPHFSYSGCSQPGWNVKYQKAGRSLCTLYPMPGFFIALIVIGAKEEMEAELIAPTLSTHVQGLLKSAGSLAGARWLMIHVTDEQVLDDVKRLIQLRRKIKQTETGRTEKENVN